MTGRGPTTRERIAECRGRISELGALNKLMPKGEIYDVVRIQIAARLEEVNRELAELSGALTAQIEEWAA